MLDGYGINTLIWDAADERLGDFLVASPADAEGRGLELHVRQGGAAADLTGASVYLLWRHKKTGRRGCEPFTAIDASLGQFSVYYPAAMQEEEGAVGAQCMVSWDDKSISTRAFTIRVEPVIIGGGESEDGFTLFIDAIKKYEDGSELARDAADAENEAAEAASDAADSASAVAAAIQEAAERGGYDGAAGTDGADGFSLIATVTQTEGGAVIAITDKNGTTTADVARGMKGDTGNQGRRAKKATRVPLARRGRRETQATPGQGPAGTMLALSGYATQAWVTQQVEAAIDNLANFKDEEFWQWSWGHSASILTDIANAIRMQADVATTYKPRVMTAAVAALDESNAGRFMPQDCMELESGILPESVFSDIADAIRGKTRNPRSTSPPTWRLPYWPCSGTWA